MFTVRLFGFEVLAMGWAVKAPEWSADERTPGGWGGGTGGEFEPDTSRTAPILDTTGIPKTGSGSDRTD